MKPITCMHFDFEYRWRERETGQGWNYMWSDCLRSTRLMLGVFTFNFFRQRD